MKKTRKNWKFDASILSKSGFDIKSFSPIHFRVTKKGDSAKVDVWPTTGKFMQVGTNQLGYYDDIKEAMEAMFCLTY